MRKIGLIVNPVAGMGGSVGLKGTDGEMYAKAVEMGADPVSPLRTREFLSHLTCLDRIRLMAAPGPMGADCAKAEHVEFDIVGTLGDGSTRADDTRRLAREILDAGAELIVFAGGDGTARDMADAVGVKIPVIAIPAGVKVYSSVFATTPRAAAELLDSFVEGADVAEQEVLDIDEEAYRAGRVAARHYGFLLVPVSNRLLQGGKEASGGGEVSRAAKQEIAAWVVESMRPGTLYLLGSGTTVRAITDELGVGKTLLGIDAVVDGKLLGRDLNADGIRRLLDRYAEIEIIVTPLGGNGFIFGRGNKQFTPDILRRVGLDHITIISDRGKLIGMPGLHVDTGDAALDEAFAGYVDVIVGRDHRKMMRVL